MYKEKLLLLLTYCIGIGYRGDKFGTVPKVMDPVFIGYVIPHFFGIVFSIILSFSFPYLFFSAIMKPYGRNKPVLVTILAAFTISFLFELRYFFMLSSTESIYFVISMAAYLLSAAYFALGLKRAE